MLNEHWYTKTSPRSVLPVTAAPTPQQPQQAGCMKVQKQPSLIIASAADLVFVQEPFLQMYTCGKNWSLPAAWLPLLHVNPHAVHTWQYYIYLLVVS
jgi:hypothetical protein